MVNHVRQITEIVKKHPLPVVAIAAAGIYAAHKIAAGSGANAAPFAVDVGAQPDPAAAFSGGGAPASGADLSGLSDQFGAAVSNLQNEIAALTSQQATASQIPGYTAGEQQYLAGYTPAISLQSSAVSAAQSAGDTLSKNCNKVTSCKGFFSCINPFRQIPALLGCAGQAVLTVGTGVVATALPAVQTGLNSVANYAPSILGAAAGIPGLPKAAPSGLPIGYNPGPGVGYSPYTAYPGQYTPGIAPYAPARAPGSPAAAPVPAPSQVAPTSQLYLLGNTAAPGGVLA